MNEIAKCVYFFDDLRFALEEVFDGKVPKELVEKEKLLFWSMSSCFVSENVIPLESNFVLYNLKQNLRALKHKQYDLAILLGKKGEALLKTIADDLCISNKCVLSIKRYFIDETLEDMAIDFQVDKNEIENIRNILKNKVDAKILFIDDIVFSGGTLNRAKETLNITSNKVDVITMVAFEEAIRENVNNIYSGIYINDATWPNASTDLWCLRDLIEIDAVPIKNGNATSFLQQKEFAQKYIFGALYGKVVEMVEAFVKEMQSLKGSCYGKIR